MKIICSLSTQLQYINSVTNICVTELIVTELMYTMFLAIYNAHTGLNYFNSLPYLVSTINLIQVCYQTQFIYMLCICRVVTELR